MANVALTYQSPFGAQFTVAPQVGLAWTGITFPVVSDNAPFGWTTAISSVTKSGTTITVTPVSTFQSLKLGILAAQGDRLQIFVLGLTIPASNSGSGALAIPFDYPSLVQFDLTNPPSEVFVGTFYAGLSITSSGSSTYSSVRPAFYVNGAYEATSGAQPYSTLYGKEATFTNEGKFMVIKDTNGLQTIQCTLILHRVSLSSEIPPRNGFYSSKGPDSVSGTVSIDAANANYNSVAVLEGETLIGIVGMSGTYITVGAGTPISMSVNYTSPQEIVITSTNSAKNYLVYNGLFYSSSPNIGMEGRVGSWTPDWMTDEVVIFCPDGSPAMG